jgi:lipid-binding SYLF domain-containing protein
MRNYALMALITLLLCTPAFALFNKKGSAEDQRKALLKRNEEILTALYNAKPQARNAIKKAYGYATFSDFGIKIFVAGGGKGEGVAVVNKTGEKTFMRMAEIQAGLGFGIKKFMLVWVFENEGVFDNFVNSGWSFGAQGTIAAKNGVQGAAFQGAVPIASGVWLYQMTAKGLAAELTVKGTKFSKNKKLNKADTPDKSQSSDGDKEEGDDE